MKQLSALIFDCDGVLVNSEEIVQDIELELLSNHGLHYERAEFARRFLGVANDHFYEALGQDSMTRLGKPLPEDFAEVLHQRARTAFDGRLEAFADVHLVTQHWRGKQAVASSSSTAGLDYKLSKTGLKRLFEPHIYSADVVSAGKPDPAIYRHTAAKLNTSAEHCLVVEDSVNGVLAGKAAGMTVVGFVAGAHCGEDQRSLLLEAGAVFVVASMAELQQQLHLREAYGS